MDEDKAGFYALVGCLAIIGFLFIFGFGWLIYNEYASKRDYNNKIEELIPLAEAGDSDAQLNLSQMYFNKHNNYDDSFKWAKMSADQGNIIAMNTVGFMHLSGIGTDHDRGKAFKWTKMAAENGDPSGQNNLGRMYDDRLGYIYDRVLSHMWFSLSIDQGDKKGQENLDRLIEYMTPDEITLAKEKARICLSQNYQNCG